MKCPKCGRTMEQLRPGRVTAGGWTCPPESGCGHIEIGQIQWPLETEEEAHGDVNGPIFADNPWED